MKNKNKSGELSNPTEEKNKPNWTDKLSSISTFLMLLVSIAGVIFVINELDKLSEQNTYLNRSLMQSFRPIGIIRHKNSNEMNKDLIIMNFLPTQSEKKISLVDSLEIINRGEGILFFTGYIYYLSDTTINFRKSFLNNGISNIKSDEIFPYTRNYPIEPGGKINIEIFFDNRDMKKTYYLYVLAFYKDQDQNLYDTQELTVLPLDSPIKTEEGYKGRFNKKIPGSTHESYYLYKTEERKKLIEQSKRLNLPISKYLVDD